VATLNVSKVKDGITLNLEAIVTRGRSPGSYAQRVILPLFKQAQLDRWESENSSQGEQWVPLNPHYAKRKRLKFASYPGAGSKLMIATDTLRQAATGGTGFLKLITDDYIILGVDTGAVPYAAYPAATRPIMKFSDEQEQEWVDGVARYIMTGRAS
jgi:hypothetical protein